MSKDGEPLLVYYRDKSRMFVSTPVGNEKNAYFLNIRRPDIFDVENVTELHIPPFPNNCDGFIFLNYGQKKSTAFLVKDLSSQVMEFPLS